MKKIATYTILFAALWSAACTHTEELYSPQNSGNELVVRTELVSASDWVTTRSEGPAIDSTEYETPDGECLIVATKEEWTGAADTLATDATNTPVTRGTPIGSVSGIANMRVNVFSTGTTDWSTSSARTSAITATNTNGSFTTSPGYNWVIDATAKTSLFAYSPIPTGSNGLTEVLPDKITYTVPTSVANQPDLCAAAPHMNVINNDGVQQVRTFALRHQLTAVGFAMLGWNLKITKITVSGVTTTGTLTMNTNGTSTWLPSTSGSRDVGVTQSSYTHTVNDNYADITTSNGYLMMIPQALTSLATVTIAYTSTGTGSETGSITANLRDIIPTWTAGDKITYNIRLKTAPAVTTSSLTIPTGYAGQTTSSPLSFLMDNKDNLTFTWSATWLRMHRGAPSQVNVNTGAASPWSTSTGGPWGNIYFFANSDNPSTAARTATITVRGTRSGSKTFTVTQEKSYSITTNRTSWTGVSGYGATQAVTVTTRGTNNWTATVSGTGLSVYPTSGTSGQTCTLRYQGYEAATNSTRTGTVTFATNPSGATTKINTSQNGVVYEPRTPGTSCIWAAGNLVYNGPNSCKIGAETDPGLYFRVGSLIGWSAGTNNDGTGWGVPTSHVMKTVPLGYTGGSSWESGYITTSRTTISTTPNVSAGTGDPCRYYLGGTWRLPTLAEFKALVAIGENVTTHYYQKSHTGSYFGTNPGTGGPDVWFPMTGWRESATSITKFNTPDISYTTYMSSTTGSGLRVGAPTNNGEIDTGLMVEGNPVRCVRDK